MKNLITPIYLVWTTAGKGELHWQEQTHPLRPFRLFVLPHPIHPSDCEQLRIDENVMRRLADHYPEDQRLPIFDHRVEPPYLDLAPDEMLPFSMLHQLSRPFAQHPPSPRVLQHLQWCLLLHLADLYRSRYPQTATGAELARLTTLIGIHHREQRSCKFYSDALATTTKKLNTLAKTHTGHLVEELVMNRLALSAEELLATTDLPVKHIAYDLGFADQAHFTRFFQQYKGLSPVAFRQQRRENTNDRHQNSSPENSG